MPADFSDGRLLVAGRETAAPGRVSRRYSAVTRLERWCGYFRTGYGRCFAQGREGLVHQPEESV